MWYVYFLELANGDVYVGSTKDLDPTALPTKNRWIAIRWRNFGW